MEDSVAYNTGGKFNVASLHPDYIEMCPLWDYLEDMYYGADRWLVVTEGQGFAPTYKAQQYIPRHPGETLDNWVSRINQSYFDDLFAKALRRYVDLAFQQGIAIEGDQQSPFVNNIETVGYGGESAQLFFRKVALSALLYGKCYLFLDSEIPPDSNYSQVLASPPYFVKHNPQDIINWNCYYFDGQKYYDYAVIRHYDYVLKPDYSHELKQRYHIHFPGRCYFYEAVNSSSPSPKTFVQYKSPVETGLDYIPLFEITGGYFPDNKPSPPLRAIADKNRALYQMESDHIRKVSLCCHPVATLKDSMRSDDEPLVIGANSYVQIRDPDGSFTWQEPLALSLQQSRRDIESLKTSIANDMAQFLNSPADRQSSAATNLMVSPVEANLESFIVAFVSGINRAINAYNSYLGYVPEVLNTLYLEPDIFPNSNKDSQAVFAVLSLYNGGMLSRETALQAIEMVGVLPDDFDLPTELSKPTKLESINKETPNDRTAESERRGSDFAGSDVARETGNPPAGNPYPRGVKKIRIPRQ